MVFEHGATDATNDFLSGELIGCGLTDEVDQPLESKAPTGSRFSFDRPIRIKENGIAVLQRGHGNGGSGLCRPQTPGKSRRTGKRTDHLPSTDMER